MDQKIISHATAPTDFFTDDECEESLICHGVDKFINELSGDIRVLSIKQPWAWLIVNGYKDIENRSWATKYRGPILIHAGKDTSEYISTRQQVRGFTDINLPARHELPAGGIVGMGTITDCVESHTSRWFNGAFGFVISSARPLPFVQMKGQLGLYRLNDEVFGDFKETLRHGLIDAGGAGSY